MDAHLQDLPFEPAALQGLSPRLIASHHQNNCAGAVRRLHAIRAQLARTDFTASTAFQLNGLKREESIATNSMLLHELYLGSLGGDGVTMEPPVKLALDANFGSVARWRAGQPMGSRPHPRGCRWRADPGAGHVRTRLPHGLRRGSRCLR